MAKILSFFIKMDDKGDIIYQGGITKTPNKFENGEGFFFSWADGMEETRFVFTDSFMKNAIAFETDYEMRKYAEKKNKK